MDTFGPWIPPRSIVQNGTVVFGPTLYTPVPMGAVIKEKIYRGINAGGSNLVRRLVGTLNDLPTARISDGVNDSFNCVRYCYAKDAIVNPSVVYVGFYYTTALGEVNFANAVTMQTSLYAVNKTTKICDFTQNGNANQVINPGDVFNESDRANVTIPAETGFYIVCHGSVTSGGLYYATDYSRNAALASRFEEGVGIANKVNSPSTIANTGIYFVMPVCLMGSVPANQRAVGLLGDSISVGVGGFVQPLSGTLASGTSYGGGIGYLAGYCDGRFDYVHFGRSGYSALSAKTSLTKRIAFMAAANLTDIWCELGLADLVGNETVGRTPAQLKTDLEFDYALIVAGAPNIQRIWQSTLTPYTDITGSPPASDTNQTVVASLASGNRETSNTTIRADGYVGMYGHVEVALAAQNALDDDWWVANYVDDGVHPNQTGGTALVSECVANSALDLNPPLTEISRLSAINVGCSWRSIIPLPLGTVARAAAAKMYEAS